MEKARGCEMFQKLGENYRKLDLLLRKKVHLYLLLLLAAFMITSIVLNVYRHQPLFSNLDTGFTMFWIYIVGYLASRIPVRNGLRFLFCLILNFIPLLIESIVQKSIVDYTSIIIIAVVAGFLGSVSFLCLFTLFNKSYEEGDSSNGTTKS